MRLLMFAMILACNVSCSKSEKSRNVVGDDASTPKPEELVTPIELKKKVLVEDLKGVMQSSDRLGLIELHSPYWQVKLNKNMFIIDGLIKWNSPFFEGSITYEYHLLTDVDFINSYDESSFEEKPDYMLDLTNDNMEKKQFFVKDLGSDLRLVVKGQSLGGSNK